MKKSEAYKVWEELKSMRDRTLLMMPGIQAYNVLKNLVPADDLYSSDDPNATPAYHSKPSNDKWWIYIDVCKSGQTLKSASRYLIFLMRSERRMDDMLGYDEPSKFEDFYDENADE